MAGWEACGVWQVIDGYSVVKAMEKVGSDGGATSSPVVITDCGDV